MKLNQLDIHKTKTILRKEVSALFVELSGIFIEDQLMVNVRTYSGLSIMFH